MLREANTRLDWSEVSSKALVVIGDDVPHPPSYTDQQVFWKDEVELLKAKGVQVRKTYNLQRKTLPYAYFVTK